jgi:hypothetical protein
MADNEAQLSNLRFITKENQEKRLSLLRELFDISYGTKCLVSISIFAQMSGWDESEVQMVSDYLAEEGLLTITSDSNNSRLTPGPHLCLTHKGIIEVEQSITNPTRATEHFPSTVIQNFNASVGAVQTGSYSTAHAVQSLGGEIPRAFQLTTNLRLKFDSSTPEVQEAATQLIEGLEDEFRLSQPRRARVRAFLKGLGELSNNSSVRKLLEALARQHGVQL